jgi:hypothetical protein
LTKIFTGGGKMPQIFKALATITVWVLWIAGLVCGFSGFIKGIILGDLYGSAPTPMSYWAGFAVALAYGLGAVVVMRLRQKME